MYEIEICLTNNNCYVVARRTSNLYFAVAARTALWVTSRKGYLHFSKILIHPVYTKPRRLVARSIKFCAVAPNVFGIIISVVSDIQK